MTNEMIDRIDKTRAILTTKYRNRFWEGKIQDRKDAMKELNTDMNEIFGLEVKLITKHIPHFYRLWERSDNSQYDTISKTITLRGRISLITYLHEYGHALGLNQEMSQAFATHIFERAYPEKLANLIALNGGMMIAQGTPRATITTKEKTIESILERFRERHPEGNPQPSSE